VGGVRKCQNPAKRSSGPESCSRTPQIPRPKSVNRRMFFSTICSVYSNGTTLPSHKKRRTCCRSKADGEHSRQPVRSVEAADPASDIVTHDPTRLVCPTRRTRLTRPYWTCDYPSAASLQTYVRSSGPNHGGAPAAALLRMFAATDVAGMATWQRLSLRIHFRRA
jgi:hypothetical protein